MYRTGRDTFKLVLVPGTLSCTCTSTCVGRKRSSGRTAHRFTLGFQGNDRLPKSDPRAIKSDSHKIEENYCFLETQFPPFDLP